MKTSVTANASEVDNDDCNITERGLKASYAPHPRPFSLKARGEKTTQAIASRFWLREEKRGQRQEVILHDSIREALGECLAAYPTITSDPDHFIFFNTRTGSFREAIRRGQAWKFIAAICADVGLRGNFGTHTLRKTWGYHARMSGVDLALGALARH